VSCQYCKVCQRSTITHTHDIFQESLEEKFPRISQQAMSFLKVRTNSFIPLPAKYVFFYAEIYFSGLFSNGA
jgi:hypothetical protein